MDSALETFHHFNLGSAAIGLPSEELYDAWSAARDDARFAYESWCSAPLTAKADRHAVYIAALDREAAAADLYGHSFPRGT